MLPSLFTQALWRWFWSGWVGSSTQRATLSSLMGNLLEPNSSSLWVTITLHIIWSTKAVPKPSVHLAQYINTAVYQLSVVSSLAACSDLITAVFDFAHSVCALKLTEHQIALFSALVLINTGKIISPVSHSCCISSFWNIKKVGGHSNAVGYQQDEQYMSSFSLSIRQHPFCFVDFSVLVLQDLPSLAIFQTKRHLICFSPNVVNNGHIFSHLCLNISVCKNIN